MKANTNKKAVWATDITRLKFVNGAAIVRGEIFPRPIAVRVTKDKHGASMSLSDDENEIMLHIPLESVRDMLQIVDVDNRGDVKG